MTTFDADRFDRHCRDLLEATDLLPPTHPNGPRRMRPIDLTGPGGAEGSRLVLGWPGHEADAVREMLSH